MISLRGAVVRAGGRVLLNHIDVDIVPGRVLAILGPNGAGKSTMIAALSGERRLDEGRAELDGRALSQWKGRDLARRRAVLPQTSALDFAFPVDEVVALGRDPYAGTPEMQDDPDAIAAVRHAAELDKLWHRLYPTLSGGERQRVHLARVMAQLWRRTGADSTGNTNRYLLLDEPTSAMDLAHQMATLNLVRGLAADGIGIGAVLHDLTLAARFADEVLLLKDGRIHAFGPAASTLQPALIEAVFDLQVKVLHGSDGLIAIVPVKGAAGTG